MEQELMNTTEEIITEIEPEEIVTSSIGIGGILLTAAATAAVGYGLYKLGKFVAKKAKDRREAKKTLVIEEPSKGEVIEVEEI